MLSTSPARALSSQALSGGEKPVTTERLTQELNCSTGAAVYNLKLAKRLGLVREKARGWVAS